MQYPSMFRLANRLNGPSIDDVPVAVEAELLKLNLGSAVKPGESVALTCGSRQISQYPLIVKAVVDHFKALRANPFLIPAMGCHGAGTAEGQREILCRLGLEEQVVGAAIRSSTETEILGLLPGGIPVYCDTHALRANHTFVLNRVSPHPMLHGQIQSGLLSMIAFGMGKLDGAPSYHRAIEDDSFDELALGIHKIMLEKANLLAGLMIVENGHRTTSRVLACWPGDFVEKERRMLQHARKLFPRLPFKFIDILLIDEIGTNFGCLGVDLNVIGRKYVAHRATEGEFPRIRTIVYRDLNDNSHGNAVGVGHAEFVRSRLIRKTDTNATRMSSLALGIPSVAAAPTNFETDREILDAALTLTRLPEKARIVWIRNTSSLAELECSEAFSEEVQHWNNLSILSGLHDLEFNALGNLRDFVTDDPRDPAKQE